MRVLIERQLIHAGQTNMRLLIWIFPVLMGLIEFVVRASLHNPDSVGFFGPGLGGAALGLMLPLTYAREMSPQQKEAILFAARLAGAADVVTHHGRDARWAQRANVALWVCVAGWTASLYLSLAGSGSYFPRIDGERTAALIGAILWLIAIILDLLRGGE